MRYVEPAGWKSETATPWHAAAQHSDLHPAGWTVYRFEPGPIAPGTFVFVQNTLIQAAACLAMLLGVVIGAWPARRWPALLLMWAAACAAGALLLPAEIAPIASGGLLAAFACLAARVLVPGTIRAAAAREPAAPVGSTTVRLAGGAALVLLAGMCACAGVWRRSGQEQPARCRCVPRVHSQRRAGQGHRSALSGARGAFQRFAAASAGSRRRAVGLAADRAAVSGDAGALGQRQRLGSGPVRGPVRRGGVIGERERSHCVGREGLSELPRRGLLDGREIPLEWDAKEQMLLCVIDEPGTYRLEVPLRPLVRTHGDAAGFEVSIPRHPLSNMIVRLPPDPAEPELPLTAGPIVRSDDGRTLHAVLGTADQWVVHWPQPLTGRSGPTFDVEELVWLKVRPGSVLLEVKAQLAVQAGQLNRLEVLADPRLRLLPLAGTPWRLVESRRAFRERFWHRRPARTSFSIVRAADGSGNLARHFLADRNFGLW